MQKMVSNLVESKKTQDRRRHNKQYSALRTTVCRTLQCVTSQTSPKQHLLHTVKCDSVAAALSTTTVFSRTLLANKSVCLGKNMLRLLDQSISNIMVIPHQLVRRFAFLFASLRRDN